MHCDIQPLSVIQTYRPLLISLPDASKIETKLTPKTLITSLGVVPALLELGFAEDLLPGYIQSHLLKADVAVVGLGGPHRPAALDIVPAGHVGVGGRVLVLAAVDVAL